MVGTWLRLESFASWSFLKLKLSLQRGVQTLRNICAAQFSYGSTWPLTQHNWLTWVTSPRLRLIYDALDSFTYFKSLLSVSVSCFTSRVNNWHCHTHLVSHYASHDVNIVFTQSSLSIQGECECEAELSSSLSLSIRGGRLANALACNVGG